MRFGIEPPAGARILVAQDHIGPGARRRQRRHQPCRPRPDHQQIAMGKDTFIAIFVVLHRQRPKARGAADQRLVKLFPEGARPHEGLVIEPRRQEGRGKIVDRQQVQLQRGPGILAARLQPLVQFLHRGADVRLLRAPLTDGHQRVGLFGPCRQHAARAVILEGARQQALPVGQQRRGQRIPGKAFVAVTVEAECDALVAVDLPALAQSHAAPPAASRASTVPSTSWVTVLRVTTSQAPQPVS